MAAVGGAGGGLPARFRAGRLAFGGRAGPGADRRGGGVVGLHLTLPLLYLSLKPLTWGVLGYGAAALLVGGLVGHLAGRRHTAAG